jgi:uncharacterized protein YecT (DUF1311 family)
MSSERSNRTRKKSRFHRRKCVSIFLCIHFGAAHAGENLSATGIASCAAPGQPACIENDSTYEDKANLVGCKTDIAHYVANVTAYQTCLEGEITQSNLEANKLIDRFKARAATKPASRAPPNFSGIVARSLLLNGFSGHLQFSVRDGALYIDKLSLVGKVVSDPARSCEITVASETPMEAKSVASPDGLARFKADIPACPFSFDVLDHAVLAHAQTSDCVFQAADCQANPGGLWGPAAAGLTTNGKALEKDRLRAETHMNADLALLSAGINDSEKSADLTRQQAAFLSERDRVCHAYADEPVHGFCWSEITLARAALLKTRLDELPEFSTKKLKN